MSLPLPIREPSASASAGVSGAGDCQVCGAETFPALSIGAYEVRECARCRHRMLPPPADPRAHVGATFAETYFRGDPAGYPDYLRAGAVIEQAAARYARILGANGAAHGDLLDVGAAAGFAMRGYARAGFECRGIEPCPAMAAQARLAGFGVAVATLSDVPYAPRSFDVVTAVQVVAHLADLPESAEALARVLKPGGHLLVETWNWRSLVARLAGRSWHEYSPPSVRQWFTPSSLDAWLAHVGFQRVATGRPRKRVLWAHARALLVERRDRAAGGRLTRAAVRAADRFIRDDAQLPYPAGDVFWSLYKLRTRARAESAAEAHERADST